MTYKPQTLVVALSALLLLYPLATSAQGCGGGGGGGGSGSGSGGLATSGETTAQREYRLQRMYKLGSKLVSGKQRVRNAIPGLLRAQKVRLSKLLPQLPKNASERKQIESLAGRLSSEQLESVEYYVNKRYPKHVKKRTSPLNPLD